ncbi:MAG: hypothetical protein RLY86_1876, partial [Pseudomonadota bacterium]
MGWTRHLALIDTLLAAVEPGGFLAAAAVLFGLGLAGLAPLRLESDLGSHGTGILYLRRALLVLLGALLILALGVCLLAWLRLGGDLAIALYGDWARAWGPFLAAALTLGLLLRVTVQRHLLPRLSGALRALRIRQPTETPSDIRDALTRHQAAAYRPADHYRDGQVFLGLGEDGTAIHMPVAEWREMNKTVVGATRFGKGITFQIWADQAIRRGDAVILIDPKGDPQGRLLAARRSAPRLCRDRAELHLPGPGRSRRPRPLRPLRRRQPRRPPRPLLRGHGPAGARLRCRPL